MGLLPPVGTAGLSAFIRADCPLGAQAVIGTICSRGLPSSPQGSSLTPCDGALPDHSHPPPREDAYVEAVLSVANASVAQLHTAGYRREFWSITGRRALATCGGPGAFPHRAPQGGGRRQHRGLGAGWPTRTLTGVLHPSAGSSCTLFYPTSEVAES